MKFGIFARDKLLDLYLMFSMVICTGINSSGEQSVYYVLQKFFCTIESSLISQTVLVECNVRMLKCMASTLGYHTD